jgi:hypothetical protein
MDPLEALRKLEARLVKRRREVVAALLANDAKPVEATVAQLQDAIKAVQRAVADEEKRKARVA